MVAPTLLAARQFRSEEELREVMRSCSPGRIQAVCKRAAAAGVKESLIQSALQVAASLREGGKPGPAALATAAEMEGDMASSLVRARRLRAAQELGEAAKSGSARQLEAARRRAEAAGVAGEDIEAALASAEELAGAGLEGSCVAGG